MCLDTLCATGCCLCSSAVSCAEKCSPARLIAVQTAHFWTWAVFSAIVVHTKHISATFVLDQTRTAQLLGLLVFFWAAFSPIASKLALFRYAGARVILFLGAVLVCAGLALGPLAETSAGVVALFAGVCGTGLACITVSAELLLPCQDKGTALAVLVDSAPSWMRIRYGSTVLHVLRCLLSVGGVMLGAPGMYALSLAVDWQIVVRVLAGTSLVFLCLVLQVVAPFDPVMATPAREMPASFAKLAGFLGSVVLCGATAWAFSVGAYFSVTQMPAEEVTAFEAVWYFAIAAAMLNVGLAVATILTEMHEAAGLFVFVVSSVVTGICAVLHADIEWRQRTLMPLTVFGGLAAAGAASYNSRIILAFMDESFDVVLDMAHMAFGFGSLFSTLILSAGDSDAYFRTVASLAFVSALVGIALSTVKRDRRVYYPASRI